MRTEGEYRVAAGGRVERHGRGEFRSGPERYDGEWDRDRMHGRGRYAFATGAEYEGELAGNCFHGLGTYRWADGARYEGGWAYNKCVDMGVGLWSREALEGLTEAAGCTGTARTWTATASSGAGGS